jgi:ribosomal protein L12E/L44/L45/RPP1/RPP2
MFFLASLDGKTVAKLEEVAAAAAAAAAGTAAAASDDAAIWARKDGICF